MREWLARTTGVLLMAFELAQAVMVVRSRAAIPSAEHGPATWGGVAALLLVGALAVRHAHPVRPGIRTTATWVAWLWDVLFVCAATPVAYFALDGLRWRLTNIESGMDGALQFVGVLGVVIGVPVMGFALTLLGGQSIEVTDRGIRSHSAFGGEEVSWDDVTGFAVGEQSIVTLRADAPVRRRLQRPLRVEAAARTFAINEPPLEGSKSEIAGALLAFVPDRLREQLGTTLAEW